MPRLLLVVTVCLCVRVFLIETYTQLSLEHDEYRAYG